MKPKDRPSCCLYLCLILMNVTGQPSYTTASKILLMPYMFKSHVMQIASIGEGLIDKGHDVYMLMAPSYPDYDTMAASRIKLITYENRERDFYGMDKAELEKRYQSLVGLPVIESFRITVDGLYQLCTNPLSDEVLFETLRSLKLDLAVADVFPFTHCLLIVLYRLGVPHVGVTTAFEPWLSRVPAIPSFVPFPLAGPFSEKMTFLERVQHALILLDWTVNPQVPSLDDNLVTKYAPEKPAVSLNYLAGKSLLWLYDTDVVIDYPRPMMQNEVNIGGISTKPAAALPKDLADFMDSATDGAIVVSFGSADAASREVYDKLLAAFVQLQQRVVWRYKFDFPAEVPDRIKMLNWVPQNDILGHANCKLFISHGGGNSQFEALYHAIPTINFPLFAEQPYNGKRAEYNGFGITMDVKTFTPDQLVRNIKKILTNTSYSESIRKRSKIFHSRPMKPLDRAVYWIEQVLLFGGDHLHSHALDLAWYEYLMLDVLALFLCLCLLCLCTFYWFLHLCCKMFWRNRKEKRE